MQGEKTKLRNLILYEVYVRNHGPSGTFDDVTKDLGRIKSLGVDVLWLMPIHPIGQINKKGSLGCPYSIQDYRKVNPEYGTLDDFRRLIDEAHRLDLEIMIDVVFNHTSHDSTLVKEQPEYFHQDDQGNPVTTVPAWADVIDLKHPNQDLADYLIDSLLYWVNLGVDGFRCDVASIIPLEFWLEAKLRLEKINPNIIWLAESVHTAWVIYRRQQGLIAHSDAELYRAFDLTYDYDIWSLWQAAVRGRVPVKRYLEMIEFQKGIFPIGFIKMRCVENHDNLRIMNLASNEISAKAWTAFHIFNQGAFLLYAGQESGAEHTPSLFDIDKIEWGDYALQAWLKKLFAIKKRTCFKGGSLHFLSADPTIQAVWREGDILLYGEFNVNNLAKVVSSPLPPGDYLDLITNEKVVVHPSGIDMTGRSAVIFELEFDFTPKPIDFELLDFTIN